MELSVKCDCVTPFLDVGDVPWLWTNMSDFFLSLFPEASWRLKISPT